MVQASFSRVSYLIGKATQTVDSLKNLFKQKVVKQQMRTKDIMKSIQEHLSCFQQEKKNIIKLKKRIDKTNDNYIQESLTERHTTDCNQLCMKIQQFIDNYNKTVCTAKDSIINEWMKQRKNRPKNVLPPVADIQNNLFFGRTLESKKRVAIRANEQMQLYMYGIWEIDEYGHGTEVDFIQPPIIYNESTFQKWNMNGMVHTFSNETEMIETILNGEDCDSYTPSSSKRMKLTHTPLDHTLVEEDTQNLNDVIVDTTFAECKFVPLEIPIPIETTNSIAQKSDGKSESIATSVPAHLYNSEDTVLRIYDKIQKYIQNIESLSNDDKMFERYPRLLDCPVYWNPSAKVTIQNFQNVKKNRWFYEHLQKQNYNLHQCILHIARCSQYDMKVGTKTTYTSFMWFKNMLGAERVNKTMRRLLW